MFGARSSDVLGGALAVVWAASAWFSGGFGDGAVGLIGITLTALVGVVLLAAPDAFTAPHGARLVAAAALVGFLVWSCASIAWADDRSAALTGAEKTYCYVLGLVALLSLRADAGTVARVLGVYVAALAVVAAAVTIEIVARPASAFADGRLQAPAGYINASVALWMLGFWPAAQLAAAPSARPAARAFPAAAATLFLGLAVLGQSRAWILISVAVALLFLLLSPTRNRLAVALAVAVGPVAVAWHWLTAVFADADGGTVTRSSAAAAVAALLIATAGAAALGYLWTRREGRGPVGARVVRSFQAMAAVAAVAVVAVVVAHYRTEVAHPVRWGETQWRSFTQVELSPGGRIRFLAPLGSDRYPEWVIAWNAFRAHPWQGIGSENFETVYLLHRRDSLHEPSFPHSIEIGLLSQLGIVGVTLLLVGLGAAFAAARRRRADTGAAVAAAIVFVYWLAHGSFDWFWEFPALAGPALGFVGLIGATSAAGAPARVPRRAVRRAAVAAGVGVALLAAVPLGSTALAAAYVRSAAGIWHTDPSAAYHRLDTAAGLSPLSAAAPLLSGSIALDLGDYSRARTTLREATEREPRNWYAWFQLALADAATRAWTPARSEIATARRLDPRDPVVLLADARIRGRRPIRPNQLNQLYENVTRHRLGSA